MDQPACPPPETPYNIRIQAALEKRIVHGLAAEWEKALWVLEPRLAARMKKPLFRIGRLRRRWGSWNNARREICLSQRLVFHHPWDAVCEVLLHEMAHQMADEIFESGHEPPHGPTFLAACHLLRANPKASGRYPTLYERWAADTPDRSEDRILRRVEKLMALSQSQNRHEAEAAMLKAHEMIRKYNLALLERQPQRQFVSVYLGKPALRHPQHDYALARLLVDFYFVQGLWVSSYVIEKGKMGRVLEISGTLANVRIAAYVHDFIQHAIEAQWQTYRADQGLAGHRKPDFAQGLVEGFYGKLRNEKRPTPSAREAFGLIPTADPQLAAYFAYRYPHTRRVKKAAPNRDETVFQDGLQAGKKLIISKGITTSGKSPCLIAYDETPI